MSETRITPRIAVLDARAPRLEPPLAVVPPLAPRQGPGTLSLAFAGLTFLLTGLALLDIANFVIDQFTRSTILGGLTLAVSAAGFGLIAAGAWRELRGLFGLTQVDHLRARLANPGATHEAAIDWLNTLPEGADLLPAVRATNDPDAVLALLRAGPVEGLRAQSEALGRAAALQVFAATAAIPSPALDGLLVGWRGARLVREVATLHGLRPGILGTLSLLRRALFSGAAVAATALATDTAARALLSNPLLHHLAGDVAGAGVAARRMLVLSRAAAVACCPVPPER